MGNARNTKTDKVCGMCGNIGHVQDIATCSKCKKASEHTYCMQNLLFSVPEIWHCEECLGTAQAVYDERWNLVEATSNFEKTYTRDKRRQPVDGRETPEQISAAGSPKLLGFQDGSYKLLDVGKEERAPIAGSPSGKHVMQPLSRNTSFKAVETGKVKFIAAEEVALLTSGVRVSDNPLQIKKAKTKSRALRRKYKSMSILNSSKAPTVLSPPNKGPADADNKQWKIQKNKASGEEVSAVLCNEKSIEGSVGAEAHWSSSKHMIPAGAECDSNAPPRHINDEHRKSVIDESSKHEAIVGPSMDHACQVQPSKAHLHDKEVRVLHNERTLNISGAVFCSDAQFEKSGSQEMDLQLMPLTNPEEKLPKCRDSDACWKGTFEVFDVVSHVYSGIQAHFPPQVSHKSYEISKGMPEKLKFKILHRKHAWPQIFELDPPNKDDIGLYFFPREHESFKEYIRLLERIDSHDFAMKSRVGDVELLVFSSKQLLVDCQRVPAETYLWGIFRHVKLRKPVQHEREQFPSDSPAASMRRENGGQLNVSFEYDAKEVDMEIDMIGGTVIGVIERPIPRLDAPPGFGKPIPEDPEDMKKPLVKLSLKKEVESILPSTEIGVIDRPIPILDAPPGFGKQISENPDGIKEPLVKFSLKKEVESILPNVPPGFYRPPTSKHGSSPLEAVLKGSAIPKKIRGFVSSSGGYQNTASEACEFQSNRHQVDAHHHNSAMHHKRSPPSLEKNQGYYPSNFSSSEVDVCHRRSPCTPLSKRNHEFNFGSSKVDVHHYNSAKHRRCSPRTPSPEMNQGFSRPWFGFSEVDDHHHESAKYNRSSPRAPSSEKNQGFYPPNFDSSEVDVHHHKSAKHHRSSPRAPSSETNQGSYRPSFGSSEVDVRHHESAKHHRSSPHAPWSENNQGFYRPNFDSSEVDVHNHESAKHHRSSPRTPSSEKNQGFAPSQNARPPWLRIPGLYPPNFDSSEIDVHHDESAKHHRGDPCTPSSEKNQGLHSFKGSHSPNAKEKWVSIEELQRKKMEMQMEMQRLLAEGRSRIGGARESSTGVPDKCATKIENKCRSEWSPIRQPYSVSTCPDNASNVPEPPLISAGGAMLALFPEETETIKDIDLASGSFPSVSEGLSLSSRQRITTISREQLEEDGCGREVQLAL